MITDRDPCGICGEPFTEAEWDARHTYVGHGEDIHARCCRQCKNPLHPPGGLLDELRQAEYLLGDD